MVSFLLYLIIQNNDDLTLQSEELLWMENVDANRFLASFTGPDGYKLVLFEVKAEHDEFQNKVIYLNSII